jgi:hypothetical protein
MISSKESKDDFSTYLTAHRDRVYGKEILINEHAVSLYGGDKYDLERHVFIYSDASAQTIDSKKMSSWAVCVQNDWFNSSYDRLPNEDKMTRRSIEGAAIL